MNFDLDEGQLDFASMAKKFFNANAGPGAARALLDGGTDYKPGLKQIAELGFYGITVPESAGGIGQSMLDLAVVAEQAGHALASPSMVTAARAAVLLEGQDELLAALVDGSKRFAVVDGRSPSIDAAYADTFLAMDGTSLVVGSGTVEVGDPIDPTRGLATVSIDEPTVLREDAAALWDRARIAALIAMAAEGLGMASAALEMSVDYANTREVFGRKIGSYQAVKHPLVDVYVGIEQLRSLVWWAAWTFDNDPAEVELAASAAKAQAAQVGELATETLIQVHGGIGFTWEHDAHLLWRRAKVDRLLLGDAAEHFNRVAELTLESV